MISFRSRSITVSMFFVWIFMVAPLRAQHASLSGSVVDTTGAAIPSASVRLLQDGKTLYSEPAGRDDSFRFANVIPSTYSLHITYDIFKPFSQQLILKPGETNLLKAIVLELGNPGPVVRVWPHAVPVVVEETPATGATPIMSEQKPCPARIRVANGGAFFLDHAGVWFRQSPAKVQLFVAGGCYPEGGPSPTSRVTIELAPRAPKARVMLLYDLLAKVGWSKDKIAVVQWDGTGR